MWKVLGDSPRGRISQRNLPLLATGLLVAIFVCIFSALTTFAADIIRTTDGFTYNGHDYNTVVTISAGDPRNLTTDQPVTAYEYKDTAAGTAEYIYFPSGTDPQNATNGAYISYKFTPPDTYAQLGSPQSIPISTTGVTPSPQNASNSCTVGNGTGWIICPVGNTIASWVDGLYGVVMAFMDVKPMLTGGPLYDVWNAIRSLANLVFVAVFLVVIFSQVTSLGISTYGIRKALPRLVIAAILVNVSYLICALAIDLSNFLGHSVYSFIYGYAQSLNNFGATQISWADITTALFGASVGGSLLIGGIWFSVATGGSLAAAIFTLFGMLISLALSLIVAMLILVSRQALLVIFTLISPFAFVALVLPSTEKWFSKWREAGMTLLIMFPLFSLVFAGSLLAGGAIILSAGGNLFIVLLGKAVQVIPLAITPLIVKFSTGILGTVARLTNDRRKGLVDRARNWTGTQAEHHRKKSVANRDGRRYNPFRWTAQQFDNVERRQKREQEGFEAASAARAQSTRKYRNAYNYARKQELDKDTTDNQLNAQWDDMRMNGTVGKRGKINTEAVQSEMANRAAQTSAKMQAERLERMHADIAAEGDTNPHIQSIITKNAAQRTALLSNAANIKLNSEEIAFEGMAKRLAEAVQKSNVSDRLSSSEELRLSIGRIKGDVGAHLVHASAIAEERKQFGEAVNARQEIMKHFKVSSQEIAQLSMGNNVQKTRDGHTVTFHANDEYTREAAIDKIFQVGAYGDIMRVIESTGVGGINYEYRATALDSLQKNGRMKAAPFLNDKAFDIILNGLYTGPQTTREQAVRRIMEGRITAADLAGAHANAIKEMFNSNGPDADWAAARDTMFGGDVAKAAEYAQNYRNMQAAAVDVLRDNQLRQNTSTESVNTLKGFLGIHAVSLDGYDWDALESRLGLR